jgi:hypothetical protein
MIDDIYDVPDFRFEETTGVVYKQDSPSSNDVLELNKCGGDIYFFLVSLHEHKKKHNSGTNILYLE